MAFNSYFTYESRQLMTRRTVAMTALARPVLRPMAPGARHEN
ncbi:hypothetical protein [Cytobacillus oceanisediminis]|nr:hypothetical protein [Cytobacillus oceanisediminis]